MDWSMLRTAVLQRLLAIVLLFSAVGAVVAQNPGDTLPVGLRVVSFEVNEDNYTGFDDGSDKKLRNALKDLNEKLSPAAQSAFKAYDLGLFRFRYKGDSEARNGVNEYLDFAKAQSDYSILLASVWASQQSITSQQAFVKLPNTLPAYQTFSEEKINEQLNIYLSNTFSELGNNPSRLKEAQAKAIRLFTIFLFTIVEPIPILEGEEGISFVNKGSGAESMGFEYDRFTPAGQIFNQPLGGNFIAYYIVCPSSLFPIGAVSSMLIDGKRYYGWYNNPTREFIGYATQDQNGKMNKSDYFTGTGQPYAPAGSGAIIQVAENDKLKYYAVEGQNSEQYNGGATSLPLLSILNLEKITQLGPELVYTECSKLPYNKVPEISIEKINNIYNSNGVADPLNIIDIEFQKSVVYDMTGDFSLMKEQLARVFIDSVDFDVLITDKLTIQSRITEIRDLKPQFRTILWIHIGDTLSFEIIFNQQLQTSDNYAGLKKHFDDIGSSIMKITKFEFPDVYKCLSGSLGVVNFIVKKLRIPEKFYNCSRTDYVFGSTVKYANAILNVINLPIFDDQSVTPTGCVFNPNIPPGESEEIISIFHALSYLITGRLQYIGHAISYSAGAWNGVVDLSSGILSLAEIQSNLIRTIYDEGYRKEYFDGVENILNQVQNDGGFIPFVSKIKSKLAEDLDNCLSKAGERGSTLPCYYSGYLTIQVLTVVGYGPSILSKPLPVFKTTWNAIKTAFAISKKGIQYAIPCAKLINLGYQMVLVDIQIGNSTAKYAIYHHSSSLNSNSGVLYLDKDLKIIGVAQPTVPTNSVIKGEIYLPVPDQPQVFYKILDVETAAANGSSAQRVLLFTIDDGIAILLKNNFSVLKNNLTVLNQLIEKVNGVRALVDKTALKLKILSMTTDEQLAFFRELAETNTFGRGIDDITEEIIDAYKILFSSAEMRKYYYYLVAVKNYRSKNPLVSFENFKAIFNSLPEEHKPSFINGVKYAAIDLPPNLSSRVRRPWLYEIRAGVADIFRERAELTNSVTENLAIVKGASAGIENGKGYYSITLAEAEKEVAFHFFEASVYRYLRITDSEYRVLSRIALNRLKLPPYSIPKYVEGLRFEQFTGETLILSERPYCPSCNDVIGQYNRLFPNEDIVLIEGLMKPSEKFLKANY